MDKLSEHIISIAKENKLPITNLKLQKVLYFTIYLAKEDKILNDLELNKLYDDKFEVWSNGPVVRSIYLKYRRFLCENIMGFFQQQKDFEQLNQIIIDLLKTDVFELVELSQRFDYWIKNSKYLDGYTSNIKYELKDI